MRARLYVPSKRPALPLREGIWPLAEEQADEILYADRQAWIAEHGKAHGTVHGILFADQLELRWSREIISEHPIDRAIHEGVYHRAYNPLLGKRPRKKFDYYGEMGFDARVPYLGVTEEGFHQDLTGPHRVWIWPDYPHRGHLSAGQCSRIRQVLRGIPDRYLLVRRHIRQRLADQYGVPVGLIVRIEQGNKHATVAR